jgi:protein-S-isoprenylcysteine O-methyltransferase Ste14
LAVMLLGDGVQPFLLDRGAPAVRPRPPRGDRRPVPILLFIVRTALEDGTLQRELAGYREYAGQVRFRLLPGVW